MLWCRFAGGCVGSSDILRRRSRAPLVRRRMQKGTAAPRAGVCACTRRARKKKTRSHVIDMSGERMCRICICVLACHYQGLVRERRCPPCGQAIESGQHMMAACRRRQSGAPFTRGLGAVPSPSPAGSAGLFLGPQGGPFFGPVIRPRNWRTAPSLTNPSSARDQQ